MLKNKKLFTSRNLAAIPIAIFVIVTSTQ